MSTSLTNPLVPQPTMSGIRTVLVVDDEPGIRAALTTHFEREGWLVTSASGVREAEYRLSQGHFDLLVSDVRLPDGTGSELLRAAKAQADTPVVLLTAFGTVPDAVAAILGGASEYLTKPFVWKDLRAIAERLTDESGESAAGAPTECRGLTIGRIPAPLACSGCESSHPATERMTEDSSPVPIRQMERLHLEKTLAMTRGNRTHAAEMLGISLRTMRNKIREYGLPPRRYA